MPSISLKTEKATFSITHSPRGTFKQPPPRLFKPVKGAMAGHAKQQKKEHLRPRVL